MTETTQPFQAAPRFLLTSRTDNWWLAPMGTAVGLALFVIYSFVAALSGTHYEWGPYLSPLYAPLIHIDGFPFSPALLILWIPVGFRATCYYFRKAYYRAFFMTPPACAVTGRPHNYRGERSLFLFQNLHRFFLYLAIVILVFKFYDTALAFVFQDGFGIGVGSIVLTLETLLIAGYVFGCNSLRHIVGGNVNSYSTAPLGMLRYKLWTWTNFFNVHHKEWAWISLFWVGFADLYVRLLSMGIITDLRIF